MLSLGSVVGNRYKILSIIKEGGMSFVYESKDLETKETVALKILKKELLNDQLNVKRFNFEADIQAKLNHPNIVKVYSKGIYDECPYIISEYITGHTLQDKLNLSGRFTSQEATEIMRQLVDAVRYLHENDIIHRDIKSQNVFLLKDNKIKLSDFGIAITTDIASKLDNKNNVVGSPHYLAPEVSKDGIVAKSNDIYALGVTYYELITGKLPFNGDSPADVAVKHIQEEVTKPTEVNKKVAPVCEKIILKALEKDPKDRYLSAEEMLKDIDEALSNKENFKHDKKGFFQRLFGF